MTHAIGIVALVAGTIAAPAAAMADPLQDQVLAAMRATRTADIAFTITSRVEQTGSAAKTIVARCDPRNAANGGWTLVSIDNRAPTAKERKDAAKNRGPVPGYARLAAWFGGPATRIAATAGSVTYRFDRLPIGTVKLGSHDASADTIAEATLDTAHAPYVSRVRFVSTASFRIMLVAKVERFVIETGYAPLTDGRVFPSEGITSFGGSLMGKAATIATRTRFSDVHSVR